MPVPAVPEGKYVEVGGGMRILGGHERNIVRVGREQVADDALRRARHLEFLLVTVQVPAQETLERDMLLVDRGRLTRPLVGAYRPAIILSNVDLPQPDVPTMALKLPDANARLMSSSTVNDSAVPLPNTCES